jgi:hypothetical protein
VAINFFAFETLKSWNFGAEHTAEQEASTLNNLLCGALAGSLSQTLTCECWLVLSGEGGLRGRRGAGGEE